MVAKTIANNIKGKNEVFDKDSIDTKKLKIEIEEWLFEYINDDDNNIFKEWKYE